VGQSANKSKVDAGPQVPAAKRFDGTGYRETMWDVKKGTGETVKAGTDWLQEKDLEEMLSKDGPSEVGMQRLREDFAPSPSPMRVLCVCVTQHVHGRHAFACRVLKSQLNT
jgi:hypothetical protein